MNPLYILLATVYATAATVILTPNAMKPKMRGWIIAAPLILGALVYGGNVVAANLVRRDVVAATRTATTETYLMVDDVKDYPNGYPDISGSGDYASLVKHGQTGTTQTPNGYTVSITNGANDTYTTNVSYAGKRVKSLTLDETARFNASQQWVRAYPKLPFDFLR